MANNRMWLVNERLKRRVLLAKYYPSTGWYAFHHNLQEKLDNVFDGDTEVSSIGPTDWVLEYEENE